jgi:hypothetical protein
MSVERGVGMNVNVSLLFDSSMTAYYILYEQSNNNGEMEKLS